MTELKAEHSFSERILAVFPHLPTAGQKACIGKIGHFLEHSTNGDTYVLRGYAGTGKTTVISSIVGALQTSGLKTVLMAPTGRAAKVVSNYSGRPAFTIHRRIYRTRIKDGTYAGFALNRNKSSNTVFIVDEASMIPEESNDSWIKNNLLEDLILYVKDGKNCKLLLVGDSAQLPPVGFSESPALDARRIMDKYGVRTGTFELTEVVRQASESGILHNATIIREAIRSDMPIPDLNREFDDFLDINGYEVSEALMDSYKQEGPDEVIVICRSNKTAGNYNRQIRYQGLFFDEEISAGDRLMCVKNNYYWLGNDSPAGFIANGDILVVNTVRTIKEKFGFRFAELTLRLNDQPEQPPFEAMIILESIYSQGPALSKEDNQKLYSAVTRSGQTKLSAAERKKILSEDPYFNSLQVKFAYAVTCHKAQGGQWKSVFIDRGYVTPEIISSKDYSRWLYTAVTRSIDKVQLIGFEKQIQSD